MAWAVAWPALNLFGFVLDLFQSALSNNALLLPGRPPWTANILLLHVLSAQAFQTTQKMPSVALLPQFGTSLDDVDGPEGEHFIYSIVHILYSSMIVCMMLPVA